MERYILFPGRHHVLTLFQAEYLRELAGDGVDYRFPVPFEAHGDEVVHVRLADAMDFLTRKDYPDNWLSETHEQFCGLAYPDWVEVLTGVGFEVDPASHAWRNDWVVDNRIAPVASLSTLDGQPLDWPVTHVLLIARRPIGT